MTETQATSGTAGTSTNPVDAEATESGASAPGGRAAVGRATVPAESLSANASGATTTKYTRAPGMAPPPEAPTADTGGMMAVPPPIVTGTATVPVVAPAAIAVAEPPTSGGPTGAMGTATVPVGTPTRPVSGAATGRVSVGTMPVRGLPGAVAAARVGEAVRVPRTSSVSRGPRRARLAIKRIDPWSVMKFSFAVSLVLFIVIIVATAVLYLALDRMGVFDSVNESLGDLVSSAGGSGGGGGFKITAKGVIGTAALLGAVNIVLVTALATLAAFVYNVCADLVGGIELTLSERD